MHDVLRSAIAANVPPNNEERDDLCNGFDNLNDICYDDALELSRSTGPLAEDYDVDKDNTGSPNPSLRLDSQHPPSPDMFDEEFLMDCDENNNVDKLDAVTSTLTLHQNIQPSPCQHPDFDLDLIDPILTEDDIPGAKLNLDNLECYANDQLKFWLACRGLHQTGNKSDFERRILNHRGLAHKINPEVNKGKWYHQKRQKLIDEAHDFNKMMPLPVRKSPWKSFPSVHIPNKYSFLSAREYLERIPEVRFSELGIIVQKSQNDRGLDEEDDLFDYSLPTQKGRADIFIDSGRVLSSEDCQKEKHYFVKGQVQASMRNLVYGVNIAISQESGKVCLADCCCWAKALGRCAHIVAVLLLIGRHVQKQGHEAITCTGRKCYWIAPSTSIVKQPGVVREKSDYYTKTDFYRKGHFDPRATKFQLDYDEDRIQELFENLSKMQRKVLWFYHLHRDQDEEQEQERNDNMETEFPDIEMTQIISEMCSYLLWNLNQIRHYSLKSNFWVFERAVRVPASLVKQAIGLLSPRSTPSGKINFMRKLVWQLDHFQNDAMNYGSSLESNARKAYTEHLREKEEDVDVIKTGIWVNPRYPQLSCSPDGIIVDTYGFLRLLEIKCPIVLANMDPNDFESLPTHQLKHFCLTRSKETGIVELKKSNLWYYQVQQSLNILNLDKCNFVVYSEVKNIPKFLSLEICYDENFWKEKRERALVVHRELIVPEYFQYNAIFKRPIRQLVYSSYHEAHDDDHFHLGCRPKVTMIVENENEVLINSAINDL
ncbi:Ribonuclease Y [Frankliniella fusca]|uniref:Ribonuclease Y n=1 Tax=Frankliniella fusca TaxID=407009 RepID=A0AAE1I1T3_9NEOP|nr:Ribonuclease Y [Frankliniella fusca]